MELPRTLRVTRALCLETQRVDSTYPDKKGVADSEDRVEFLVSHHLQNELFGTEIRFSQNLLEELLQ